MKKKYFKLLIFMLILVISIGFAYLSTELLIKGTTILQSNKWLINWDKDSIDVVSGSVTASTPTVDTNKTTTTYEVTLNEPGDYYDFSIDAVNGGTIDAMISAINITYKENNTATTLPSFIHFSIKYANDQDVAVKDLLKENDRLKYYINIEYDRNVTDATLISTDRTFVITVAIEYEQADSTANEITLNNNTICLENKHQEITSTTVCKRATNLLTEKCLIEDETKGCRAVNYSKNDEIIYGTCGTSNALVSGDAFDCDVDGNGKYEEEERFYYVSPRDADINSEYATLIYYRNYEKSAFDTSNENNNGPVSLLEKLPSTEDWKNVELVNNGIRQITNELGGLTSNNGNNLLPNYTYTNKAARLLTYKEIATSCNINNISSASTKGSLNECRFLFENTSFSSDNINLWYWLETPKSNFGEYVYAVYITDRDLNYYFNLDNTNGGVRPAIEVPLKNIAY